MKIKFANGTELSYIQCINGGAQFFKENMRESRELYIPCTEISFDNLHGLILNSANIAEVTLIGDTAMVNGSEVTPTATLLNFSHTGYIAMCDVDGVECWKFRLYEKSAQEQVIEELMSIVEV